MRIRLFKTDITVSFLFFSSLCLLLLSDKTGLFSLMLVASLLHESAHLAVMAAFGNAPDDIKLVLGGVSVSTKRPPSFFEQLAVSFSGPVTNLMLFGLFFWLSIIVKSGAFLNFALINLLYFAYNMLPLSGLDGGSILNLILNRFLDPIVSKRVLNIITVAFGVVLLTIGFIGMKTEEKYPIFIVAAYLILSVIFKF